MKTERIQVWDLPTRLFHWLLVIAVLLSYVSIEIGGLWADWHARFGSLVLMLVVFRVLWGFWGNKQARFSQFFPTPKRLHQYITGQWHGIGHSPLGALAVFTLLFLISLVVITGLFANDDITIYGPFYSLVSQRTSEWLTGIHELAFNILLACIALHLFAIFFYWAFKKNNLIKPMLTGEKVVSADDHLHLTEKSPAQWIQFVICIAIALLSVCLIFGGALTRLLSDDVATQQMEQPAVSQHQW